MAAININVGTAANSNDGDTLRAAFQATRQMFHEIYGISTSYSDSLDLSTGTPTFAESVQDIVGAMFSGNTETNITATYQDSDGTIDLVVSADLDSIGAGDGLTGTSLTSGDPVLNVVGGDGITSSADEIEVTVDDSTIELSATNGSGAVRIKDLGVTTAKLAADAVNGDKIADDAINSEHYTDGSIDTAHIADDNITHAKLEGRYTTIPADISTTTGTINLACDSNANFRLTGNLGTCTLNLQNMKTGQVVEVLCDGSDLSSAAITLTSTFTTESINKIGTTNFQGSKKNLFVFSCLDDTDSDAIINYTVNEVDVDDTDQP